MSCKSCGCTPCTCPATVLNNPQIIGGIFDGPVINGATINGGTSNQQNIVGASIDCSTQGCTQPAGICNDSLATTAFTCTAISNAISSANEAFCQAVGDCLASDPTILCPTVAACINTTPGIINNTQAFGVNARATTALYGVTRYATAIEMAAGSCLVAVDPCTLATFWTTGPSNALWTAFETGVLAVLATAPAFCAQVFACGVAPLASPALIGVPTAPTAAPGTNSTQLATTAFVNTAITNALNASISSLNAAFCAAVAACGGGGGGGGGAGNFASFTAQFVGYNNPCDGSPAFYLARNLFANYGCSVAPSGPGNIAVSFSVAQPDTRYVVTGLASLSGGTLCPGGTNGAQAIPWQWTAGNNLVGVPAISTTGIPEFFIPISDLPGHPGVNFGTGVLEVTYVFSR